MQKWVFVFAVVCSRFFLPAGRVHWGLDILQLPQCVPVVHKGLTKGLTEKMQDGQLSSFVTMEMAASRSK